MGFDLSLDVMHHRHGSNENNGRDELVRVQAGMKESPGNAYGRQRLHHFKVAGCGCAREMQSSKIYQEWDPT